MDYQFAPEHVIEHQGQQIPMSQHPEILKTPDVPTLVKRFDEGLRELGKRERLPTRPEEAEAFYSKVTVPPPESLIRKWRGAPEAPDKYEWKAPEGASINEEWLGKGKAVAHELGLNNDQFGKLVSLHNELMQDAQRIFQTKQEEGVAVLKSKWGEAFDANFAAAARGAQAIFKDNPEALAKFTEYGLANDPAIAQFMLDASKLIAEDSSTSGGTPNNQADIQAQIDTYMQKGGANYERWSQGDAKALSEVQALYNKLHQGEPPIDLGTLGVL